MLEIRLNYINRLLYVEACLRIHSGSCLKANSRGPYFRVLPFKVLFHGVAEFLYAAKTRADEDAQSIDLAARLPSHEPNHAGLRRFRRTLTRAQTLPRPTNSAPPYKYRFLSSA